MKKTNDLRLKALVFMAMLSAVSIILGKYLAIPVGDILRFSFENLPIIFAGIVFGPVGGALVGTVADLVGCVLVGYAINPLVTLGAFSIGCISGLVFRALKKYTRSGLILSVGITVGLSHLIGSVLIKTLGLSAFYSISFPILLLWRLLNYAIVGVLEGLILTFLLKNKRISSETAKFREHSKDRRDG